MTSSASSSAEQLVAPLEAALSPLLGPVRVHTPRRLTGGASRETWAVDAEDDRGVRHELVLRRDPPGRPGPRGAMALEARAIALAHAAGVAVPEVLIDSDSPETWGAAGMVMRRVAGEALGRRILRDEQLQDARNGLVEQCAAALAGLHAVDADLLVDAPEFDPLVAMRALLDDLGHPVPTFEYALRWLERHRPPATGRAVVHGDFRLGNLLVDRTGLTAVLDWELVHVGDPIEDLGWFCVRAWRFGAELPVAGLGTREELLDAYVAAGGTRVAPEVLRWWEAYGTLRWGVICLTQTAVHLRGDLRSVELAAIGRRVCETEWDLLLLLAPEAAAAALTRHESDRSEDAPDRGHGLHGRPDAVDLVDAVREFLSDQVVGGSEGSLSYHARVAANVLGMVSRELAAGERPLQRRALALAGLGVLDEEGLCAALRAGVLEDRDDQVVEVLAEGVVERVAVANPRYLQ
jgi:aminoglycoside phosphotransferase (APT) family kinase protein